MTTLATLVVSLIGDVSGFKRSMDEAEAEARGVGGRIGSALQSAGAGAIAVGQDLTRGLTLPLVAIGTAATVMSNQFETSMQHIVGLVGKSQTQVDAWANELKRLGPELGKTPDELAQALYFVTSAGIDSAKAIDVVTAAAKASAAGLGKTQVVADAVSSALNAYAGSNLSAAQATSILVATVREGKGEADQIAPALGRVIPVAAQLGISFDQVGATMASMTLVGFDAAESATNLSGIMSTLLKPTSQAEAELANMGLSAAGLRQQIKEKGLLNTLQLLSQRFGDNEEAIGRTFGNVRALRGFLTLTGENAAQTEKIFKNLAGTTENDLNAAFDSVAKTGAFKFQQASAQLQATLIDLGAAIVPVILPMLQALTDLLKQAGEGFAALSPQVQQAVVVGGLFLAVLGPLLTVGGTLLTVIGAIAAVISGPLVLAVGAAIAIMAVIAANWDAIWNAIKGTVESIVNAIRAIVETIIGAVQQFMADHGEEIRAFVDKTWNAIKEIVGGVIQILATIINEVFTAIATFINDNQTSIQTIFTVAWESIRIFISVVLDVIRGIVNAVLALSKGDIQGALNAIKGIFVTIWEDIKGVVSTAAETVRMLLALAWLAIQKGVADAWNGIRTTIEKLWEGIMDFFRSLPDRLVQIGKDMINGIVEGIKQAGSAIRDALSGLINNAIDNIKKNLGIQSPSTVFADIGLNMMAGLAAGIGRGAELPQLALDRLSADMALKMGQAQGQTPGQAQTTDQRQFTLNVYEAGRATDVAHDFALMQAMMG